MTKKLTNKTIDEETIILPYVIAEIAAEKAVGFGMNKEFASWEELNKKQKEKLDASYKKELQEVIDYLVLRANTTFQYSESFRKKVKGAGNKGRDYLYMFMYHWVGVHEGRKIEPNSYKRAMANYYKAMELHAKQN